MPRCPAWPNLSPLSHLPRGCSAARVPRTWSPRRSPRWASRCWATSIRPSTRSWTRSLRCWRTSTAPHDGIVLPLQSTGTSGMEAGIVNLVEPGDTVIVGSGRLLRRAHRRDRPARHGAERRRGERRSGGVTCPTSGCSTRSRDNPGARLVAVVHGETSTGVEHPLAELGEAMGGTDTLLMADCVTTLGGVRIDFDAWGVDYAYSCTQKCLGAPPGLSPIAVSPRALERIETRTTPVPFSLDLRLLRGLLRRPARRLPPHHSDPARVRPPRGAAPDARGGRGARAGSAMMRPADASPRAHRRGGLRSAGRGRAPARAAHRGARARGDRRQARPAAAARRARPRGRRRAGPDRAADLARGPDGSERDRGDGRPGARRAHGSPRGRARARWPASAARGRWSPSRCWRRSRRWPAP